MPADWFARVVGLAGLLIALASLGWNVFEWWSKRLKVSVDIDPRGLMDERFRVAATTATVRNTGGQPFSVVSLSFDTLEVAVNLVDHPLLDHVQGIEGMFRRVRDLPVTLGTGETARWAVAPMVKAGVRPNLASMKLVVGLSDGRKIRKPITSSD